MVLFKAPEPTTAPPRKSTKKAAAAPADEASDEKSDGAMTSGQGKSGQDKSGQGKSGQAKSSPKSAQGKANQARSGSAPVGHDDEQGRLRRRLTTTAPGTALAVAAAVAVGAAASPPTARATTGPTAVDEAEARRRLRQTPTTPRRQRRRLAPSSPAPPVGRRLERRRLRDGSNGGNNQRGRKRNPEDEITSIGGSTRLEAKKQRRREGREAGRRRAPIVSEAEFLARRESVDRVMVIRQKDDLTQIGVLEDKVLVEHYVARESQTSLIGNVYVGRVQNVLPSMEAAFIDIGKGRNAVLYAGEVNWAALGHKDGQQRKIESVLSSGQSILVQVTKDPVGHKGARLTGQVSLPGRFLVYVPDGNTSGISRKLPDTERTRLKTLLKQIVPDSAGVIVRTAAEGASEEELTLDVERLTARWADIEEKVKAGKSPQLLYGEPDLTLKVVRDLFTEDFAKLVVQGRRRLGHGRRLRLPRGPRPPRPARAVRPRRCPARTCSPATASTSRSPRAWTARCGCPRAAR